jgi:hypothetical protein
MRSLAAAFLLLTAFTWAPSALASEPLADRNVKLISLAVNAKGEAMITYAAGTKVKHVLVWGAVNALTPSPTVPQVRFKYDYAGGWGKYRKLYWKTFKNACGKYDGPDVPYTVATCKAPDGSYWVLQSWQRNLPLLGFEPFKPEQDDWELHVSHWTGPLPELEVHANWTYDGSAEGVFGRLTYLGEPVHGFGANAVGNPRDRYGRNVYIDTYNSVYGEGWKRESGILVHKSTGTFCHSFVPQKVFAGYPNAGSTRPAAPGKRYRVTVMGPGVTPVVQWEAPGLPKYDPDRDKELNELFDTVMEGDTICKAER